MEGARPSPKFLRKPGKERRMAVRVRTVGCLTSIIVSVVLTIVLNLLLRACSGPPAW
jgi:hypothetical protein